MSPTPVERAAELGQSVWIDNLSRDLLQGGGLRRMIDDHGVVGLTTNPTIFQKAIGSGDSYDDQMRRLYEEDPDPKEVFVGLATTDVADACDLLRKVWDGGGGKDGYVSIEVDPRFAHDTAATVEEAVRLRETVDRPNVLVKIPATPEGLPAIEEMIARGASINVTLIFSLERYTEVAEAYIRGIERLVEGGGDPSRVCSVASFFVSRVDTEADRRLDEVGGHDDLKGLLAVANAKLAYERYGQIFSGERWEALAAKGATPQRCLWASTSMKDPARRDVLYVEELIGPQTVNTMPEETLIAFQDHGVVEPRLTQGLDEAHRIMERFAEAGVDYDDVTRTLEREGVQKFAKSFDDMIEGISAKWAALSAV